MEVSIPDDPPIKEINSWFMLSEFQPTTPSSS